MGQKVRFEKTTVQTIEAIQFDGGNYQEILDWVKLKEANFRIYIGGARLFLEGSRYHNIAKGDWVMRNSKIISVVKDEVIQQFAQGYENWKIVPTMPAFELPKDKEEEETNE